MLGVRRHSGVQIDLWQGDAETFVADHAVVNRQGPAVGISREELAQAMVFCQNRQLRHLRIAPFSNEATLGAKSIAALGAELMATIRDLLNGAPSGSCPSRITFVLANGEQYRIFQACLFAGFPDL